MLYCTFYIFHSYIYTCIQHSLCILDELGRGTATFDGTAIAHAVVHHLTGHSQCRAMFATHYHTLIDDWGRYIRYMRMYTLIIYISIYLQYASSDMLLILIYTHHIYIDVLVYFL